MFLARRGRELPVSGFYFILRSPALPQVKGTGPQASNTIKTMLQIRDYLVCIILVTTFSVQLPMAQERTAGGGEITPEQQYEELISRALSLQVRADSLSRSANQKRRELAFSEDAGQRQELGDQILALEEESFKVQKEADSLYSQARALELRILAGNGGTGVNRQAPPSPVASPSAGSGQQGRMPGTSPSGVKDSDTAGPEQDQPAASFLMLGGKDISPYLTRRELSMAPELEQEYVRAGSLMGEASDMNDEIERLGKIMDQNSRRSERRRITNRIGELQAGSFSNKMEAMQIYQKVHSLRYSAASGLLEEARLGLSDSLVIRSGMAHEESAREGFRQAALLRETAPEMSNEKYLEGFVLRAYMEELNAFAEMEKAYDIYAAPPVASRRASRDILLSPDGRVDAGAALSRATIQGSDPGLTDSVRQQTRVTAQGPVTIDFGFSVRSSSFYSADNPIPADVKLPAGIVYTIQLGIFNSSMTPDSFGGLYPLMYETEPVNNSNRYYTGVFSNLPDAETALGEVSRQGFTDAFIVAYNNGSKLPVNRARQMELSRQQVTPLPQEKVTEPPAASYASADPGAVVFKIQLGVFRDPLRTEVLRRWQNMAGNKNVGHSRNNNGLYVYSIGNFNNFEEAVPVRDRFINEGVPDAFIVPYQGERRITMQEAGRLIRQR